MKANCRKVVPHYRTFAAKEELDSRNYRILTTIDPDPYPDDYINAYRPRPFRWKRKQLLMWEVRMYRTWKHNRRNQWKEKFFD